MNISEFIKDLQAFLKKHGDLPICVFDSEGEYKYDMPFLRIEMMPRMNADTEKVSKRNYKTCVISQIEE